MLQLGVFAIMQLCFVPVFHSCPCSRCCSLLLPLEGGFASGACPVSLSECAGWLAFVRVFCPQTQDLPLRSPFICNWSCKTKGLLPKKPYLRESSRMLLMQPGPQKHPVLPETFIFLEIQPFLLELEKANLFPWAPKDLSADPLTFPKSQGSHWDDLTILLSACVHSIGRFSQTIIFLFY